MEKTTTTNVLGHTGCPTTHFCIQGVTISESPLFNWKQGNTMRSFWCEPPSRKADWFPPSQGKLYLGRWKSSAGAGFESSAPIFAVSWFLAPRFTSRSLVETLARLFDREEPSTSLPEGEFLILSFLTGEGKDEPE